MTGTNNPRTTVRTISGRNLDLLNPDPAEIDIEDIAHHLSMTNRYNGGTPYPFSVAQHSILVASILPDELKLWGLLHDSAETFTGDLVGPGKKIPGLGDEFKKVEDGIMDAICAKFNLPKDIDYRIIKAADKAVQAVEMTEMNGWADVAALDELPPLASVTVEEMHWQEVKKAFLKEYYRIIEPGRPETITLTMGVNMDGLRFNMGRDFAQVYHRVSFLLSELDGAHEMAAQDVRDAMDELRATIAGLFCISDESQDNFTNMSDETDIMPKFYKEKEHAA